MQHLKQSPIANSPAAAYRADMAGRQEPFGPDDDQWLLAASLLHGASHASRAEGKLAVVEALAIALEVIGDSEVERLAAREWDRKRSKYDALMLLADRMHDAGALHLAARMLDDLASAPLELTELERGRVLALRARVEWKLGRLDDAADRYRYIESLGTAAKEPELSARAALGLGTIAQLRGNFPEMSTFLEQAARIAEKHDLDLVARRAYHGLTVVRAKRGQFNEAFVAAWRVLEMSGDDPVLQTEALQNLGQLMLETGHLTLARSSFSALLSRPIPARALLPALGGLALTSARLGAEPTVEWAVREIWRAQSEPVPRYELTVALLEAAGALRVLGRVDESGRYHQAGLRLAETSGYHELAYVARQTAEEAPVTAVPLNAEAAAIGARVAALEPQRLPKRLRFDPVPV